MKYESIFGSIDPELVIKFNELYEEEPSHIGTSGLTSHYKWKPEGNDLIDLKAHLWKSRQNQNIPLGGVEAADPSDRGPLHYQALSDQRGIKPLVEINDNPVHYQAFSDQWGGDVSNASRLQIAKQDILLQYGASYSHESVTSPADTPSTLNRDGTRNERQRLYRR